MKLKDQIQIWLNSGRIEVETPARAATIVEEDPFPSPEVNMVELQWPKRDHKKQGASQKERKAVEDETEKASTVILCHRCKKECGFDIDQEDEQRKNKGKGVWIPNPMARSFEPLKPKWRLFHSEEGQSSRRPSQNTKLFSIMKSASAFMKDPLNEIIPKRKPTKPVYGGPSYAKSNIARNNSIRAFDNHTGGRVMVNQSRPFQNKVSRTFVPSTTMKPNQWYTQRGGHSVPLSTSQKRRIERQYGQARRAIKAVELGLVDPDQMTKTHDQLKADMQRLSVRYHGPREQTYKYSFATTHMPNLGREYWKPKDEIPLEGEMTKQPVEIIAEEETNKADHELKIVHDGEALKVKVLSFPEPVYTMPLPKIGNFTMLSPTHEIPGRMVTTSDDPVEGFGDSDEVLGSREEPMIPEEDDAMSGAECSMVYVLPAKYAISHEEQPSDCHSSDVMDFGGKQIEDFLTSAKNKEKEELLHVPDPLLAEYMCFVKPTMNMANQLRPIYITAHLQGVPINKILVDNGSAINVLPSKFLQLLKMDKERIQPTSLTVKNFAGSITKTHGLLFIQVDIGSKDIILAFFIVDCISQYNALLGRDWIHRSPCVPSSLHQQLVMWNEDLNRAEVIAADPRPYAVSANAADANYYFSDIAPLGVNGIDQNGRPMGVTTYELTRWGLAQAKSDMQRPFIVIPEQTSP